MRCVVLLLLLLLLLLFLPNKLMKTILMIASRDTSISTSLSNVLHKIKSDNIDHIFINQISKQIAFSLKQSNSFKLRRTFMKFKATILSRLYQLVRKLLVLRIFLQLPRVQMTYHLFMICQWIHKRELL